MSDETVVQSHAELRAAQRTSLESQKPPAEVPGYNLERRLGSGAFGEVWAGIDQKTGRRVAIKFYTRKSSLDVTLLSSEVEKLVYLSADRYVVQLLDVGWQATPPYYVMDYIENGSLEQKLKESEPFDLATGLELFEEIATGLMHLHGKGVLHCDLKPGNVLLDRDFKPRLADFGQSRLRNEQSPSLGTLYYMAPEQADLEAVPDARWDVYALGALLYTMLTGRPPYRNDTLSQQLEKTEGLKSRLDRYRKAISAAPPPSEHRKIEGIDKSLIEIIDRCIAVDPKKRFASVQSVLLALRQREERLTRRPLIVLGILGPVLLLLTMSVFGYFLYDNSVNRAEEMVVESGVASNEWVAQLAARSAGENIDMYMLAVRQLAEEPGPFRDAFRDAVSEKRLEQLREQVADPRKNNSPQLAGTYNEIIAHEARRPLDAILEEVSQRPGFESAASWFACDKFGNQIAVKYLGGDDTNETRGRNYSYRTYFTGLTRDLDAGEVNADVHARQTINGPNISAVFESKGQNILKVAFSVPIEIDGNFAGIVAVSVELGEFARFRNSKDHYVVLIDSRLGTENSLILEHPYLDKYKTVDNLSVSLANKNVFNDPIFAASHPGEDPIGVYGTAQVMRTRYEAPGIADAGDDREANLIPTGWQVVAVENYREVIKPVNALAWRLLWMLVGAAATALLLAGVLWAFLSLVIRARHKKLARKSQIGFDSLNESTGTGVTAHSAPTEAQ